MAQTIDMLVRGFNLVRGARFRFPPRSLFFVCNFCLPFNRLTCVRYGWKVAASNRSASLVFVCVFSLRFAAGLIYPIFLAVMYVSLVPLLPLECLRKCIFRNLLSFR